MNHRRELINTQKHLSQRNTEFGTGSYGLYVDWLVYDTDSSDVHPVYGDGQEKIYHKPRRVNCLWLTVSDPENEMRPEGRDIQKVLNGAVTSKALESSGIPEPLSVEDRLNDVVIYRGDFYNILTFDPRGHLGVHLDEQTLPFVAVRRLNTDNPLDVKTYKKQRPLWY